MRYSPIFSELLIKLGMVAGSEFAFGFSCVELGFLDLGKIKISKDAGRFVDQAAEIIICGGETQQARDRKIWDDVVEDEAV